MKCKGCKREIEDNSVFCNWCGKYQLKKPRMIITVPKPTQLPSGNWRIQLRKEGISVVANTPEKCIADAKIKRKLWIQAEESGLHEPPPKVLTLGEVVDNYIAAKSKTLSASTLSSYQSKRDFSFKNHWDDDANNLNPQDIINDEVTAGYSAKTIYNAWGLCSSALKYAGITVTPPTLPKIVRAEHAWLDYNQIQIFLEAIHGQHCELGALLALHSLRRSEIFGLRVEDYDQKKQIIHIRGAMLSTIQSGWVRTELNKNDTSRRDVPIIIPRLAELLKRVDEEDEYIIGTRQKNLYREINAICRDVGLPEPGLHGLRHSFASLAYHLGWKKLSTQEIGGWKNSRVLDQIYTHNADLESDLENMREYFRGKTVTGETSSKSEEKS